MTNQIYQYTPIYTQTINNIGEVTINLIKNEENLIIEYPLYDSNANNGIQLNAILINKISYFENKHYYYTNLSSYDLRIIISFENYVRVYGVYKGYNEYNYNSALNKYVSINDESFIVYDIDEGCYILHDNNTKYYFNNNLCLLCKIEYNDHTKIIIDRNVDCKINTIKRYINDKLVEYVKSTHTNNQIVLSVYKVSDNGVHNITYKYYLNYTSNSNFSFKSVSVNGIKETTLKNFYYIIDYDYVSLIDKSNSSNNLTYGFKRENCCNGYIIEYKDYNNNKISFFKNDDYVKICNNTNNDYFNYYFDANERLTHIYDSSNDSYKIIEYNNKDDVVISTSNIILNKDDNLNLLESFSMYTTHSYNMNGSINDVFTLLLIPDGANNLKINVELIFKANNIEIANNNVFTHCLLAKSDLPYTYSTYALASFDEIVVKINILGGSVNGFDCKLYNACLCECTNNSNNEGITLSYGVINRAFLKENKILEMMDYQIEYDDNNNPTKISNNDTRLVTTFQYDNNNRIVNKKVVVNAYNSLHNYYVLSFNSDGSIKNEQVAFKNENEEVIEDTYTSYNSFNQVISETSKHEKNVDDINLNNTIFKTTNSFKEGSSLKVDNIIDYEYSDDLKINKISCNYKNNTTKNINYNYNNNNMSKAIYDNSYYDYTYDSYNNLLSIKYKNCLLFKKTYFNYINNESLTIKTNYLKEKEYSNGKYIFDYNTNDDVKLTKISYKKDNVSKDIAKYSYNENDLLSKVEVNDYYNSSYKLTKLYNYNNDNLLINYSTMIDDFLTKHESYNNTNIIQFSNKTLINNSFDYQVEKSESFESYIRALNTNYMVSSYNKEVEFEYENNKYKTNLILYNNTIEKSTLAYNIDSLHNPSSILGNQIYEDGIQKYLYIAYSNNEQRYHLKNTAFSYELKKDSQFTLAFSYRVKAVNGNNILASITLMDHGIVKDTIYIVLSSSEADKSRCIYLGRHAVDENSERVIITRETNLYYYEPTNLGWEQLIVTYNSNSINLYVNGERINNANITKFNFYCNTINVAFGNTIPTSTNGNDFQYTAFYLGNIILTNDYMDESQIKDINNAYKKLVLDKYKDYNKYCFYKDENISTIKKTNNVVIPVSTKTYISFNKTLSSNTLKPLKNIYASKILNENNDTFVYDNESNSYVYNIANKILEYELSNDETFAISLSFRNSFNISNLFKFIGNIVDLSMSINNEYFILNADDNITSVHIANTAWHNVYICVNKIDNDCTCNSYQLRVYFDEGLVISRINDNQFNFSKLIINEDKADVDIKIRDLLILDYVPNIFNMYDLIEKMDDKDNIEYQYNQYGLLKRRIINNSLTTVYEYSNDSLVKETTKELSNYFISYNYDSYKRVTSINVNNEYSKNYTYDSLNQLVKETINNTDYNYNYDANGNMISFSNYSFTYDSLNRLTKISNDNNTIDITYNANSLLMNSYGGKEVKFEGKKLVLFGNVRFYYNDNGLLVKKEKDGVKTYFEYDSNNNLIRMKKSNDSDMVFLYDSNNELYGFNYNKNTYYYIKDSLKEIKGIVNSNNTIVYKYIYSGYGLELQCDENYNISDDFDRNIVKKNPFRYKCYFYDEDVNLYYLKSRFYNPLCGRFLTDDDEAYIDESSFIGFNLFTYCGNDPVNKYDPNGHAPKWLKVVGLIGLFVGIILCRVALDILCPGISAVTYLETIVMGSAKGTLIGAGIGFGIGAIAGGVGALISGEKFGSKEFWSDVGYGAMTGFGIGAVIGALAGLAISSNGWYNQKALEFTNSGSSQVFLGKNPTYYDIAKDMKGTSFHVSDKIWDSTAKMKGVNMWKINKAFLKQQIAQGHQFVFTSYNITGLYAKEVAYVMAHGTWAFLG